VISTLCFAVRLIDEGQEGWVGARDTELGEEAARTLDARFVQLDVTDDASVETAAALVAKTGGILRDLWNELKLQCPVMVGDRMGWVRTVVIG
jgi:NAD(P)-dependent dehydrogenase (short-subunit alcohol dehydrogenase family)